MIEINIFRERFSLPSEIKSFLSRTFVSVWFSFNVEELFKLFIAI